MKIVKAVWEKRNLGYDAYEIVLDKRDLKKGAESILEDLRAQNFIMHTLLLRCP